MRQLNINKSIFILYMLIVYLFISPISGLAESYTYPDLISESAVLLDANTGQVLFEKNMNKKQYPASITKIMTGMIALEKGNLTDTLTMSSEAVFLIGRNTSHVALDVGEELTLEEALYGLSIESGNDAANGIAEYISGNIESFAELMNKKAKESGALNTNFVNPHGLSDSNQYTTAYDMAQIMKQAVKIPQFREIFSKRRYEMPPTNLQSEIRYFISRNPLVNGQSQYEGVIASKTGWTPQSNHTLVTAAKQGDRELIAVVLNSQGSNSKYEDTIKLLDYGFNDFKEITFDVTDFETIVPLSNLNTIEKDNLIVKPDEDIVILVHKSLAVNDIETSYKVLESISNEIVNVKISLNTKQPNSFMYENLGDIFLTFEAETIKESSHFDIKNNRNYYIAGLSFIFIYMFLLYVKRKINKRRNQRMFRMY